MTAVIRRKFSSTLLHLDHDPLSSFVCAFCSHPPPICRCLTFPPTPIATPRTKLSFLRLLALEANETTKLQAACTSYLSALEKNTPLGKSFNADQNIKINRMRGLLELVRERFEDLARLVEMTVPEEEGKAGQREVSEEMMAACDTARDVLANCCGNLRECHVCLKLNYTLVADAKEEEEKTEVNVEVNAEFPWEEVGTKEQTERERVWMLEEGMERESYPMLPGMWEVEIAA